MAENFSPATPVLRQDRANVLAIEGDIDLHISPAITEALNAMIKKKPERIVIDLSRATYIDSAGVAALILAMREVKEYGGKFFLSGVQESIRSILGKAEFMNPGGSVKDRAAYGIITDAEAAGRLKPGATIVEGTAGNTGIGLAVIGRARGYRTVIVIPNNQSPEKMHLLRTLGAD